MKKQDWYANCEKWCESPVWRCWMLGECNKLLRQRQEYLKDKELVGKKWAKSKTS